LASPSSPRSALHPLLRPLHRAMQHAVAR
jgi:hypothetical protein